jgi:hypothetical protein
MSEKDLRNLKTEFGLGDSFERLTKAQVKYLTTYLGTMMNTPV